VEDGVDAGKLRFARTFEQMTVLMITLDGRSGAGFRSGRRFTG
jgi:hypothetical protein